MEEKFQLIYLLICTEHVGSMSLKVETPITNNLRVLANMHRLNRQMNIFPLCRDRKYAEC